MKLLGDPHIGRSFIHGVPLARRGERETMQFKQFRNSIMTPSGGLHICMGDLFDKAIVPYEVIKNVADAYIEAATKFSKTMYVILKGNHDWLRDLEKPSAFDLFAKIVAHIPNIKVVNDHYQIGQNLFCAWHPTIPAAMMVLEHGYSAKVVFGHWDIEDFGGDNLNLIPTEEMEYHGVTHAYTGHIHKPHTFERDGVQVTVVGSMQPYAHGEEIEDSLYQTITKQAYLEAPAGSFHNKCLRIDLSADELLDIEVDCLQLTVRKEKKDKTIEVVVGDFDMGKLFTDSFAELGVSEETTKRMYEAYEASRLTNG